MIEKYRPAVSVKRFSLIILSSSSGDDDDEDAPMISGFSDDVPMVIA